MINFFRTLFNQIRSLNRSAKLFFLATMIDGAFYSGWILFFNLYILKAGFDLEFLGLINAVPVISALVFGIPMGMISDRIGRKPSMLIGFIIATLTMILLVLYPEPWFMILMAAVWGGAGQLYGLSRTPFMMEVSNKANRDLVFSIGFALFPLASTFGNAMFGQFPKFFTNLLDLGENNLLAYEIVLISSALLSLLSMIPIAMIRKPDAKPEVEADEIPGHKRQSIWPVVKDPTTIKLAIPELTLAFGAAMIVPFFNVFFTLEHGLDSESLGWTFSLLSLLTGIACLIGPRLVKKMGGTIKFLSITLALGVICFAVIGFSPITWLVMISFLIRGSVVNMGMPLFDAFSMEQVAEKRQGLVNSIRLWAWNVGWAAGLFISGIVQKKFGFSPIFIAVIILYIISISLILMFFSKVKTVNINPETV
jgi:MFS family permease